MNEVDESGSCLHEAALYGKTEVVKLLLDVSADQKRVEHKTVVRQTSRSLLCQHNALSLQDAVETMALGSHAIYIA